MIFLDNALITALGFVTVQTFLILAINTMRGFWDPVHLTHLLCAVSYCIYLALVIYASKTSNRSDEWCDTVWKITATSYIVLNMAVYSFYYTRSKVWKMIKWEGKDKLEQLAPVMIPLMGLTGLGFFYIPIRGVQYNALLVEGECQPVKRQWIAIVWLVGDTALSFLLLVLFVRPLQELQKMLGDAQKSMIMLLHFRQFIQKNCHLLGITVLATVMVYIMISFMELKLSAIHYLCVIDRLITLQCITLSFSYDSQYYNCFACLLLSYHNHQQFEIDEMSMTWQSRSNPSVIYMSPKLQSASIGNGKSSSVPINFGTAV
jgi:hypothetical protein